MKILLPIDGSGPADDAVRFVAALAETDPVEVTVVMVTYSPDHPFLQPGLDEWEEEDDRAAKQILKRAEKTLSEHCRSVETVHKTGTTEIEILRCAKEIQPNLIVLGATGRSGVRRVLLGSVSDTIATRAHCSVAVIRPSKPPADRLQKVLVGFDKTTASREAIAELMEYQFSRDLHVEILSVAKQRVPVVVEGYAIPSPPVTQREIEPIEQAAQRMASQVADHFPRCESRVVVEDHVGEALITAAGQSGCEMLVVGDRGMMRL